MDNLKNSKKDFPKLATKLTLSMVLSATFALSVGCDYAKTALQSELKNNNTALQTNKQNLANKPVEENPDTNDTTDTPTVSETSKAVQIGDSEKSTDTEESTGSNDIIAEKPAIEVVANEAESTADVTDILKSSTAFSKNKSILDYSVKSSTTETSIYDFDYELNDNDEVIIKKYNGTDKEIVIPEDFNGYSVVEIGSSAFYYNRNITSVTLPSTVKKISDSAFNYCTALTNVNLNEGLEEIGGYAFYDCYSLSSIKIPDSCLSIGYSSFEYCTGLTSVDLGKGIQTIGSYAFERAYKLTSVVIPDSVTSLGDGAFYYCSALSSIVIGEGITTIPANAFRYSAIETLNIPDNILFIKNNAFQDCDKLLNINWGTGLKEIGDYAFADCDGFTEFTIPDTVVKVGNYTFGNCSKLVTLNIGKDVDNFTPDTITNSSNLVNINASKDSVYYATIDGCLYSKDLTKLIRVGRGYEKDFVLPYSVTVIGEYAFSYCQKLPSITLTDNIVSIERYAFQRCTKLTSLDIGDEVEYLGDYAFYYCTALKSIDLGKNLTNIGEYSFANCSSLETVELPDTVTVIKRYGFHNCSGLTSIQLSCNLATIEEEAFYNCYSLKSIDIPNSVTTLGSYTFEYCYALEEITLGLGIKTIPYSFAYNCKALKEITIPENVETISNYAFKNCSALSNIKFNSKLTQINYEAFNNCDALTVVDIPDNVKTIGDRVFAYCDKLTTLNIGSGVTTLNVSVVDDTPSLTSINVSGENTVFASLNGVLFNKDMTKLISYPRAKAGEYKMPDTVVTIGSYAFEDCKAMTAVTMSKALTTIESYGFIGCTAITSLEFGDNLNTIGYQSFTNCSGLTSVKLGINTKTIDGYAFSGCTSIESIDFGKSLTSIGGWAFYNCSNLPSVVLPDTVTTINSEAFYYCTSLKSVKLGSGLKTIGTWAFEYCTSLESIEIPDAVTNVGGSAFYNCSALKSVKIGRGTTSFPYELYGCTALESITVADENTTYASYNGVLFNKDLTNLMKYPAQKSGDFIIPDTVNTISSDAFRDAKKLTSIKEYGNVFSVGSSAFYNIDKTNFKAYVIEGSYMETYCKNNSITYETIVDTRTQINNCTVTYDSYVKYTGSYTYANLTITNPETGAVLVKDTDYKAFYNNNYYTGTATIEIYGMGEYGGHVSGQYTIYRPVSSQISYKRTGAAIYTITSTASNGIGDYKYKFEYINKELVGTTEEKWTEIENPDNLSQLSYYFEEDGTFKVRTTVTDDMGDTAVATTEVVVTAPRANLKATNTKPVYGESINVVATGTNFNVNKQYKFEYKSAEDEDWTVLSDYSTETQNVDIRFNKVGTFYLKVTIKDSSENIAEKTLTFNIAKPTVTINAEGPTTVKNQEFTINAGVDKTTYKEFKYKYQYKNKNDSTWTTLSNYTDSQSQKVKFTEAGEYVVKVTAKSTEDSSLIISSTKTYKIQEPAVVINTVTNAEAGDTIDIGATATNFGNGVTYKFQYKVGENAQWNTIQESENSIATLKLMQGGTFTIRAIVTDSVGNSVTTEKNVEVRGMYIDLNVENTTPFVGETSVIVAEAKGFLAEGTNLEYKFEYRELISSTWHTLQDYSELSYTEFVGKTSAVPDEYANYAGAFEIRAIAKDESGNITVSDGVKITPQKMKMSYSLSNTNVEPGTEVTAKVNVTGGFGEVKYLYEYSRNNGDWQPLVYTNYVSYNEIKFKFSAEGTYRIRVTAKDSTGTFVNTGTGADQNIMTLKVAKPVDPVFYCTLSVPGKVNVNQKCNFIAEAGNGSGDYTYKFTISDVKSTTEKVLQDYNENNKLDYTPKSEGTYQVTVYAKDSSGKEITTTRTINVIYYSVTFFKSYATTENITVNLDPTLTNTYIDDTYTFKYEYRNKLDSNWTTIQEFSDNKTLNANFADSGVYEVRVTAKNSEGIEKVATTTVTVNEAMQLFASALPDYITAGSSTVIICDTIGGTNNKTFRYSYCAEGSDIWYSFADNSNGSVAVATFEAKGTYKVRVIATDSVGATSETYLNIYVG
ncbi:MAG: leucine-rich repeat protein [Acutalibacteraceae bacterium]|nr:leucine-rich repeat protein [Acutalibacteraceae bacterium]